MHSLRARIVDRRTLLAAIAIGVLGTAGCAQMQSWLQGRQRPVPDQTELPATDAASYLNDMYLLAGSDPAAQAETYADADAAARLTPGPSTRLRLALVLAVPGHAESNAEEAQSMLRELLAGAALLTPGEETLATIMLRDVEERLKLSHETERLQDDNERTENSEQLAVRQRIARVEAENRALRESLAEAEQKLDAITSIERSIREQSDNGSNPR